MFGWLFGSKDEEEIKNDQVKKQEFFHNPTKILNKFTEITGIHFNQKETITTNKLISFCRNNNIYTFDELYDSVMADRSLMSDVTNLLTVNETYFFRESSQIYFVSDEIADNKRAYRILCAPGSTGEEPYSIAISLLEKNIPAHLIEIVSLDINSDVKLEAERGCYNARSLHKMSLPLREKYFTHKNGEYCVNPEVKKMVKFQTLNIFDELLFALGKFDIIFSRNMLIYFEEPVVEKAVKRLVRLAKDRDTKFFFGHADFVKSPPKLQEHYKNSVKYYTTL